MYLAGSWIFTSPGFFREIIEDDSITRNIAEYLFEKEHFEEALDIFKMLLEEQPDDRELLEKAGYCYQKMGNFREAIQYYTRIGLQRRAEYVDPEEPGYLLSQNRGLSSSP